MKTNRFPGKKLFLVLLAALFVWPPGAFAQEAVLKDIIITNTRDDLLVYLKVQGAFTEKIERAIMSGVPTSFSFLITLYRVRDLWPDEEIADLKLTNTIKYDNLKKEFRVTRSWKTDNPRIVKSFQEAKKLMTDIDSLRIVPLSQLKKGFQYQLRAKAELSKHTLPFYLHYVLFFLSLWDFETDWYTIDFIY